jgi:hypothetical protein
MEMREMHEAELQLRDADTLAPLLSKKFMGQFHDHYVAMCATWELQNGNLVQAEKELKQATNPEFPSCLRVNARLHLARQEFVQAEELLRKYQAAEKKKGTLHRPDLLKSALDFAESLYGQAKHEKALAAFQEARSTAADFAVPADAEWGATLEIWRKRAEGLSRVELAKALEKEIAQIAAMPSKAITILQKFQVHPVRSQPE